MNVLLLFERYFIWFIIYSVAGWIYESTLCSVREKSFVNRGFLNGPICPVYGCGAVLDIIVLGRIDNPLLLFFLGAVLTCTLEYITSWAMEKLFHARWWDYSQFRFNLNGRVCLLGAAAFGAFSVVLIKLLHPFVSSLTDSVPALLSHIIAAILVCAVAADAATTVVGISGFNEKLRAFEVELKSLKEKASEAIEGRFPHLQTVYEGITERINRQERRILKAFPKLKSINHNETLSEIKNLLKKLKSEIIKDKEEKR